MSRGRGCPPTAGKGRKSFPGVSSGGRKDQFSGSGSGAPQAGFVFKNYKTRLLLTARRPVRTVPAGRILFWRTAGKRAAKKRPVAGARWLLNCPPQVPFAWSGFWKPLGPGRQKWPCPPGGRTGAAAGAAEQLRTALALVARVKEIPSGKRAFQHNGSPASAGTGRAAFAAAVTPVTCCSFLKLLHLQVLQ